MVLRKWMVLAPLVLAFVACSESDDMQDPESEEETMDDPQDAGLTGDIVFAKNLGGSDDDFIASVTLGSDGTYVMAGGTESTDGDIIDKSSNDRDVWVVKTSAQGDIIWSKTYGGTETDEAASIAATSDGGYIVSGYTRSSDGDVVSGNAGSNDYWVLKLNGSGDLQWEKTYGYSGNDRAYNIKPTADGGYFLIGVLDVSASGGEGNITRSSNGRGANHAGGDFWAIKTDAQGEILWARYYGGTFTDTPYDFVELSNGTFIIIGSSDSTDVDISNNKGDYDFWLVHVSATGDIIWDRNFGGSEIDLPYGIVKTTDGNFMVVGDTRSADQDVNGSFGNADIWAVKFNASGNIIWENNYGGSEFESARNVSRRSNGQYVIVSSSRSSDNMVGANYGVNDVWVIVVDEEGTLLFEKNLGGSALDFGLDVIETASNELLMVGDTESTNGNLTQNKGGKDAFVVKLK